MAVLPRTGSGAHADSIACPSAALCVARDAGGRSLYVASDPAGGAATWKTLSIPGGQPVAGKSVPPSPGGLGWPAGSVACPTVRFCAVLANGGQVDVSTAPENPASWTGKVVDPAHNLTTLSCPSANVCVAADDAGGLLVAVNPARAGSRWRRVGRPGSPPIYGISCSSRHLCAATDAAGNVVTSINPDGQSSPWTSVHVGVYGRLSCPSTTLCVASDGHGGGRIATDPTGGLVAWSRSFLLTPGDTVTAPGVISCPSTMFCAAAASPSGASGSGEIWATGDPVHASWRLIDTDTTPNSVILGISCPSPRFCAAVDNAGNVLVGRYSLGSSAAPAVAAGPDAATAFPDWAASFAVTAAGNPAPSARWQVSSGGGPWTNLTPGSQHDGSVVGAERILTQSGATMQALTIANVQPDENGDRYRAVLSDSQGAVTSPAATLTVQPLVLTQISAGNGFTCGLRPGGARLCWGDNFYGAPEALSSATPAGANFTQISAGHNVACGLQSGGAPICWGLVPTGVRGPFTAITAGDGLNCGLRRSGTAMCWGSSVTGRGKHLSGTFTQISAGNGFACGVRRTGAIACWGKNTYGRSVPPAGNFVQVSAGHDFACGVQVGGVALCWGDNRQGQALPPSLPFTQISAGTDAACGRRLGGLIVCWGNGAQGETRPPRGIYTQVSLGDRFACALRPNGTPVCWGAAPPPSQSDFSVVG